MKNATLATAEMLSYYFGYTVEIDGDAMIGRVYCGDEYLYDLIFNWS